MPSRALCVETLCLVLLSVLVLPASGLGTVGWAAWVLLMVLGKSWLISEQFMELRHAPKLWRMALLLWPLLLGLLLVGLWSAAQ